MNFIIEEFKDYKTLFYSHHTNEKIVYGIELPLPEGRAILRFYDGHPPENHIEKKESKTIYYIGYCKEQFMPMVDSLRHEAPMYFYYNFDNHESYVTSEEEEVGEYEVMAHR